MRGGGTTPSLRATMAQVIHSARPISRPGTIPAMNSLEIDTLAVTPKMIKPIDGGSTGAITPDRGNEPGSAMRRVAGGHHHRQQHVVSAAASATALPDSADSRIDGDDGHVAQAAADVADQRHREFDDALATARPRS